MVQESSDCTLIGFGYYTIYDYKNFTNDRINNNKNASAVTDAFLLQTAYL